jgi:hypothetical protein
VSGKSVKRGPKEWTNRLYLEVQRDERVDEDLQMVTNVRVDHEDDGELPPRGERKKGQSLE